MSSLPTILGGDPLVTTIIPFVRPKLPNLKELHDSYAEILESGMVTTGPYADKFGHDIATYLGVKYAVAVSSCTTGLVLAFQSLSLPEGSEVILPSFTFIASGIAPVWNTLKLRFVDVDPDTMNIDPEKAEAAITPNTSAILGVHQFGNPAPIERLQAIADKHQIALVYDAAHGFGASHQGRNLGGNGKFEVFSLSPTKLVIAAEGGIVATNDEMIAEHARIGRNYGNPGNYDCLFPGLNARMSELHAILALQSLAMLKEASENRNRSVSLYVERLGQIPGIRFQKIRDGDVSSYKDFTIVVDEKEFGINRVQLIEALAAEHIQSRVYYSPILHQMQAFAAYAGPNAQEELIHSLYLESHALSLPLFSDMADHEVELVCDVIARIHAHAGKIAAR
jgi:dTDP-4-amino-4,6-dideoxygalactose transaminase